MIYLKALKRVWNEKMRRLNPHALKKVELQALKDRWNNSFIRQRDIKLFLKNHPELIEYVEQKLKTSAPHRTFKLNDETIYSVKDFIEWLEIITKGE